VQISRVSLIKFALSSAVVISAAQVEAGWSQTAASQASSPATTAPAQTASTTDIAAIWQGTLHVAELNKDLRIELKIEKAGADYKTTFYSIDQGGQALLASSTSFANGTLSFEIAVAGLKYEGKMSADGKTIIGTSTQGPTGRPLVFARTSPDAAWPIPEPVKKMAASADPGFDVVTIKPGQPGRQGKGYRYKGTHFQTINTSVNDLIDFAYGLHSKQIVGAPDWFATELYDIDGIPDTPGEPNLHQMGLLFQKMLPERFALKFHHEQRELSVYIITQTASGSKMAKTKAAANDSQTFGFRDLGDLVVGNLNMKEFANWMQSGVMDRPVVDHTGLTDKYDFTLKWTPDDSQFQQYRGAVTNPQPPAGDNPNAPPSLYTAMQETLGLKIEAGKAMYDVIVIDHVEKPSAN